MASCTCLLIHQTFSARPLSVYPSTAPLRFRQGHSDTTLLTHHDQMHLSLDNLLFSIAHKLLRDLSWSDKESQYDRVPRLLSPLVVRPCYARCLSRCDDGIRQQI